MPWFEDLKTPKVKAPAETRVSRVPDGLWVKCPRCGEILQSRLLEEALGVCLACQHHLRVGARERIAQLTDPGSFKEYGASLRSRDPLSFDDRKSYSVRLKETAAKVGMQDSFVAGKARLQGLPFHLGVFEFQFMGGSMGAVTGEKVAFVFEHALSERLPAVVVSSSGGARMQEGILSLMQMAKTTALIHQLRQVGVPYISVLTDPTTGGVAASFAMLGDLILAEPGALIGFAGPRVIEQTMRQALPPGFQRAEFLLRKGFIDRIVPRQKLAGEIADWMLRLGGRTCRFKKK